MRSVIQGVLHSPETISLTGQPQTRSNPDQDVGFIRSQLVLPHHGLSAPPSKSLKVWAEIDRPDLLLFSSSGSGFSALRIQRFVDLPRAP